MQNSRRLHQPIEGSRGGNSNTNGGGILITALADRFSAERATRPRKTEEALQLRGTALNFSHCLGKTVEASFPEMLN